MSSKIAKMARDKGRALGIQKVDMDAIERKCKREIDVMKKDAETYAYIMSLAIPLHILASCYWEKTANKRVPQLLRECLECWDSLGKGTITEKEIYDVIKDMTTFDWEEFKAVVGNKLEGIDNLWRTR